MIDEEKYAAELTAAVNAVAEARTQYIAAVERKKLMDAGIATARDRFVAAKRALTTMLAEDGAGTSKPAKSGGKKVRKRGSATDATLRHLYANTKPGGSPIRTSDLLTVAGSNPSMALQTLERAGHAEKTGFGYWRITRDGCSHYEEIARAARPGAL